MSKKPIPDFNSIDLKLPLGAYSSFDMACIYPALIKSKKNDVYLEVGVDKGKSLAFARKYFKGDVFGIDPKPNPDIPETNFINKLSNDVSWDLPINILFIDGDHSYQGAKDDWNNFSPFVVKGGWVFFHDADATSPGVVQVTEEIGKGWGKVKYSPNPQCSMAWVKKL